jgi:glycosyltransferase involved in cell wall biosynthesis
MLSIAIPTYNRQAYLRALLASIQSQAVIEPILITDNQGIDPQYEVYIYDNGDHDLSEFGDYHYSRNATNIGGGANVHQCYTKTPGDYIWCIGDDELMPPMGLQTVLDYLSNYHPGMLILHSPGYERPAIPLEYYPTFLDFARWCDANYPFLLLGMTLMSSHVIRRDVYDAGLGAKMIDHPYGHMAAKIAGMLRTNTPVCFSRAWGIVVRNRRPGFAIPIDLTGYQLAYLEWLKKVCGLSYNPGDVILHHAEMVHDEIKFIYDLEAQYAG